MNLNGIRVNLRKDFFTLSQITIGCNIVVKEAFISFAESLCKRL